MAVPLDREANFLAFEKKNNRLMAALRQPEYADVMEFIRARRATVIAPQNETLKEIPMNRSFIETHVIDCFTSEGDNTADNATTDESAEEQKLDAFVSVNGVRGVFTTPEKEALHVLAGPPSDPEEVVAVVTDTASRFAPGSVLSSYVANTRDTSDDVYVLRHTQVTIGDVNADFMIISRPLTFEKCPWEIDEFGAGMLLPTDSHLSDSTQGDSQSVPAIETPPPSYATQAHTGATAGGDLISFDDTNSSIASAGMEHPTASAASELSAVPVTGDAGKAVRPLSRGSSITDGRDGGKDSRRKRESSLSSFKESMRDPSCHGFVRMIRAFCDDMETHPPTIVDMQSRYIAFTVTMEEKFSTHPLFKDSMESTMESLEKYVCVQTYTSIYRPPEDEEIDTWLGRRIDMLTFLTPENLEIAPHKVSNKVTIEMAGNELKQMNRFKSPRAKLVCVVNCCKIIFRLLQQAAKSASPESVEQPASADDLMPILIYVILVTNPMNFKSNLMYIERFRNPRMLVSEQAYYYTTMVSAVEFVSNLDEKTLNIDPDDFERQVDEGEAKWNMSLRPRNVSNTDANNKDAASAKSSSGSWRLGRRTLLSSLQSYVSEVPNILNRGSGSGTTRVDQPDSKEITTPEPKASASRSNTSPLPVNIASEAQNNGATTEQGLDRDAVIQYMKSLATNYSGTDPRLRVLNVEDLDFENVPLLLREYQRMAGLMDHMMELIHDMP